MEKTNMDLVGTIMILIIVILAIVLLVYIDKKQQKGHRQDRTPNVKDR